MHFPIRWERTSSSLSCRKQRTMLFGLSLERCQCVPDRLDLVWFKSCTVNESVFSFFVMRVEVIALSTTTSSLTVVASRVDGLSRNFLLKICRAMDRLFGRRHGLAGRRSEEICKTEYGDALLSPQPVPAQG